MIDSNPNIKGSNFFLLDHNEIDLNRMEKIDRPLFSNKKSRFSTNNDISSFFKSKKINLMKDSFYNSVLSTKEMQKNFANIHQEENLKSLQNEDKSNSSLFIHIQIINNLESKGEIKKMEEKMNNDKKNINIYQKESLSLISNIYKCSGIFNDFNVYRKVKANGNSFYISFMYQYIKSLIQYKNESIISGLFYFDYDFNNGSVLKQDLGKNYLDENNISVPKAHIYLSMIYRQLVESNIDEALNILEYTFTYEENFSELLCLYMRYQIKKFITNNREVFTYEKYCEKEKLINEQYFDNKKFLYGKYIEENVEVNKMEPSLFIISIVPYVFNITLNLYINEQNSNKEINEPICDKIIINPNTKLKILIVYTSYSYHIVDNMDTNDNIFQQITNEDVSNIFNITRRSTMVKTKRIDNYFEKIDKICDKCNNNQFIKFKTINNEVICLKCFRITINKIFINRYKYMNNENFSHIEYYLRDIPLIYDENTKSYAYLKSTEFFYYIYFRAFFRILNNKLISHLYYNYYNNIYKCNAQHLFHYQYQIHNYNNNCSCLCFHYLHLILLHMSYNNFSYS